MKPSQRSRPGSLIWFLALAVLAMGVVAEFRAAASPHSREWHVRPSGLPGASGTPDHPVDLISMLDGQRVKPGDTIWLHGGEYAGRFQSYLTGTAAEPIIVRQWPGERAILTGTVERGEAGILNVFGAWTVYRDFELSNKNPERTHSMQFRPMGIEVQGPHTKLINLVIHDVGIGVGLWDRAVDSEVYGTTIFNSGSDNTSIDKRHGHGIYSHGTEGTRFIRENVIFNQFGWGLHIYSNTGPLRGYVVEGNVAFNNGSQSGRHVRFNNILILGYGRPVGASAIAVRENFTYHSFDQNPGSRFSDANAALGCDNPGPNGDLELINNYFAGGYPSLFLCGWQSARVRGNTILGPFGLVRLQGSGASIAQYEWDNNRYFAAQSPRTQPQFAVNGTLARNLEEWRARTKLDAHSSFDPQFPHGGPQVFVRPNHYESERANIIVYNWRAEPAARADVSVVLKRGARFEVRDVQDLFGPPVLTGTYDGMPLRLPLTGRRVTYAVGRPGAVDPTGPEFKVFQVRSTSQSTRQVAPVVTSAVPAPRPAEAEDYAVYVGTYRTGRRDGAVEISLQNGRLQLTALSERGKPVYTLDRVSPVRFRVLGTPPGFFVDFEVHQNRATKLILYRGSDSPLQLTLQ